MCVTLLILLILVVLIQVLWGDAVLSTVVAVLSMMFAAMSFFLSEKVLLVGSLHRLWGHLLTKKSPCTAVCLSAKTRYNPKGILISILDRPMCQGGLKIRPADSHPIQ